MAFATEKALKWIKPGYKLKKMISENVLELHINIIRSNTLIPKKVIKLSESFMKEKMFLCMIVLIEVMKTGLFWRYKAELFTLKIHKL